MLQWLFNLTDDGGLKVPSSETLWHKRLMHELVADN